MKTKHKAIRSPQNKHTKQAKAKREGITLVQVLNTTLRVVISIEDERHTPESGRELLVLRPWRTDPEWVPGHQVIEIKRLARPLPAAPKPLTADEFEEYSFLMKLWCSNDGQGADFLSPEKIARFSILSDRVAAHQK